MVTAWERMALLPVASWRHDGDWTMKFKSEKAASLQ